MVVRARPVRSAYAARRINPSTFLIVHDDKYDEKPYVYAKIYSHPPLIVLIDTGVGPGAALFPPGEDAITDLRDFIETVAVPDNNGKPLNPRYSSNAIDKASDAGPLRDYMIILSHCHYDHIGGIATFASMAKTAIVASGFDRRFAGPDNREHNSLCDKRGMALPQYTVTLFADDGLWLTYGQQPLQLQAVVTPGHTPDTLAIYDAEERWLYVGDSFYRRECTLPSGRHFLEPILFPEAGNLVTYFASLQKLDQFVRRVERASADGHEQDAARKGPSLKLAASHTTAGVPAREEIASVRSFFSDVVNGTLRPRRRSHHDGECRALWVAKDGKWSLFMAERLLDDVRVPA